MSTKKIEAWKANIGKGKNIFVANNVRAIHPVVDRMVRHLLEIDLIQYVRVRKEDIQASNDIMVRGRTKDTHINSRTSDCCRSPSDIRYFQ